MNLKKDVWSKKDKEEYRKYLFDFKGTEKQIDFEKKITKTNLPCIAVPSKTVDFIVKEIAKGNFYDFINLKILDYHTDFLIYGKLICRTEDFKERKNLLFKFSKISDSWAHTDCLYLKANKKEEEEYFDFAEELLKSDYIFSRRLAYIIMLKNINEHTIDKIIGFCAHNCGEKEYYVNMAVSWLISECFIKFREKTLELLTSGKLNDFVSNMAIRKCLESYRVSESVKRLLKELKLKQCGIINKTLIVD